MKSEGDQVTIGNRHYTLGKKIGGGQEGTVFEISDTTSNIDPTQFVIKLINDTRLSVDQKLITIKRIETLVRLGKEKDELRRIMAMPKASVKSDIGYVMRKAIDYESLNNYLELPEGASPEPWYNTEYTLKKRLQIIVGMFEALRTIHLSGLIFTDLSPNNILVHKTKNSVVFIDTDNLREKSDCHLSVLGTPGYMAPEIYRENVPSEINGEKIDSDILSKTGRISVDSDIFSAAIIAFKLLVLHHPFVGDVISQGTAEDEERAEKIQTDYIFKEGTDNYSTEDLCTRFEELTTPEIRKLFMRTFTDGVKNPLLRPTDIEFVNAFKTALDYTVTCPDCGYTQLYNVGKENLCINCDRPIPKQMFLFTYSMFINDRSSLAEGINSICPDPYLDIDDENLRDLKGKPHDNLMELSRVLLDRGNVKTLYQRHFEIEDPSSADQAYVQIEMSKTSDKIIVRNILKSKFDSAYTKNMKTDSVKKIKSDTELDSNHYVVFMERPHGKGTEVICSVIREC